jgi:hypothetical protein
MQLDGISQKISYTLDDMWVQGKMETQGKQWMKWKAGKDRKIKYGKDIGWNERPEIKCEKDIGWSEGQKR